MTSRGDFFYSGLPRPGMLPRKKKGLNGLTSTLSEVIPFIPKKKGVCMLHTPFPEK